MLKNYLRIAFRNIVKYRIFSIINIAGMAIGMACVLLIGLLIRDDLSYDRFHENAGRIYRVTKSFEGAPADWVGTPSPLGPALGDRIPDVDDYVRFDPFIFKSKVMIKVRNRTFYEEGFMLADPSVFKVFSFRLLKGDPETALSELKNVVLSRSMAEKYFGQEDPIGQTISFEGTLDLMVGGIMEDVPPNSHIKFDILASYENIDEFYGGSGGRLTSWTRGNYYTYWSCSNS
jgi:putative ABC transport system permease protein